MRVSTTTGPRPKRNATAALVLNRLAWHTRTVLSEDPQPVSCLSSTPLLSLPPADCLHRGCHLSSTPVVDFRTKTSTQPLRRPTRRKEEGYLRLSSTVPTERCCRCTGYRSERLQRVQLLVVPTITIIVPLHRNFAIWYTQWSGTLGCAIVRDITTPAHRLRTSNR
jgi:hypothetical protein